MALTVAAWSSVEKPALWSARLGEPGVHRLVQHDVLEHAPLEHVEAGEQGADVAWGDALHRAAQPRLEAHALVRRQQQRVQEGLAELAVAGPRLAGPGLLEGADVDEHRPRPDELEVVGVAVLHR